MMSSSGRALLLLLIAAYPCSATGQSPTQTPPGTPYTLYLSSDLVQLPVLVLNPSHQSQLGLIPSDFRLNLDSGPTFLPTHLHMATSEPLSVTLLLDASTPRQVAFLQSFQRQAALLPLGPRDRFTVLAFDCTLIRPGQPQNQTQDQSQGQPATVTLLKQAIASALTNPSLHAAPGRPCTRPLLLWDAVHAAASLTGALPGRRILLVISPGPNTLADQPGTHTWEEARRYAGSLGFTAFGIRDISDTQGSSEDPFSLLCGGTGGLVTSVPPQALGSTLIRLFNLIRNRYILDFPRPANGSSGLHHLDVTVLDQRLLVRASGFTIPLLDPATLPDPTLTPDPVQRPVVGPRKPLSPPPPTDK